MPGCPTPRVRPAHDRSLAKSLLNVCERRLDCLAASTLIRSSAMTYISFFRSFSQESAARRLLFAVRIARSITHPAREWNSVSHLQRNYFRRVSGPNFRPDAQAQPSLRRSQISVTCYCRFATAWRWGTPCVSPPVRTTKELRQRLRLSRSARRATAERTSHQDQRMVPRALLCLPNHQMRSDQGRARIPGLADLVENTPTLLARRVQHDDDCSPAPDSRAFRESFAHEVLAPAVIKLRTNAPVSCTRFGPAERCSICATIAEPTTAASA